MCIIGNSFNYLNFFKFSIFIIKLLPKLSGKTAGLIGLTGGITGGVTGSTG